MANRTVKDAQSIKGTNPQYLVEKIIRTRIYECKYWKEECFALTAELIVDKGMELKYVGGVYGGNIKPSPFLCILLKMLQIQPEKDIIVEFIRNEDFKYLRAIGALYMRVTGTSLDCYKYLEPLYNDYRKLKHQKRDGSFDIVHMDEFIDDLLKEERVCDIILPRVQKRQVLEEVNELEPRISALEDDLDDIEESEDEIDLKTDIKEVSVSNSRHRGSHRDHDKPKGDVSPWYRRSRSRSPRKRRSRSRDRDRKERHRHRSRDRNEKKHRSRSRDRKRDRDKEDSSSKRHKSKKSKHDKDKEHHHKSSRDRSKHGKTTSANTKLEREIEEANALRAELGLPPLK